MDEDDRLAVGADLGLVREQSDVLLLQVFAGGLDVVHLEAQMMHATLLVLLEKVVDRTLLGHWIEQLQLGVVDIDEDGVDAVLRLRLLVRRRQVE